MGWTGGQAEQPEAGLGAARDMAQLLGTEPAFTLAGVLGGRLRTEAGGDSEVPPSVGAAVLALATESLCAALLERQPEQALPLLSVCHSLLAFIAAQADPAPAWFRPWASLGRSGLLRCLQAVLRSLAASAEASQSTPSRRGGGHQQQHPQQDVTPALLRLLEQTLTALLAADGDLTEAEGAAPESLAALALECLRSTYPEGDLLHDLHMIDNRTITG